jgi:hypothetical protein
LARLAETKYRGSTLDDALRSLLFEHLVMDEYEGLERDPEALAEHIAESRALAEVDVEIKE